MDKEITLLELIIKIIRFFRRHLKGYVITTILAIILAFVYNTVKPISQEITFQITTNITPKQLITNNLSNLQKTSTTFSKLTSDTTKTTINLTLNVSTVVDNDSIIQLFSERFENDPIIIQYLSQKKQETKLLVNTIKHFYNLNDSLYKTAISSNGTKTLYNFLSWMPISTINSYVNAIYKLNHFDELSQIRIQHIATNDNSLSFAKIIIILLVLTFGIGTIIFVIVDLNNIINQEI